jgi:hypothetical protein
MQAIPAKISEIDTPPSQKVQQKCGLAGRFKTANNRVATQNAYFAMGTCILTEGQNTCYQ